MVDRLNMKIQLLSVGALCVLVDQVSKWYVAINYPSFVVLNAGVAFNLGATAPSFVIGSAVVLVLLLIGWVGRGWWLRAPFWSGLFFGGAVSNVIDRLFFNGVRDWIAFPWLGGVMRNNIADVLVNVAVIGLLVITWKHERKAL